MIALKALLLGVGFSVFGTIIYVVFLIWYAMRGTPFFNSGVRFDITSLSHNTYLAPAYWLFVLGLICCSRVPIAAASSYSVKLSPSSTIPDNGDMIASKVIAMPAFHAHDDDFLF